MRVVTLGQKGHVVELVGTTEANVQLGIMKMKVQLSNLEKTGSAPQPKQPQKVATTVNEHGMIMSEWNWICAA